MQTKDFINTSLPLLGENQKIMEALNVMKEFHLEHATACINGSYGFFSYNTLSIIPEDTILKKVEQLMHKIHISTKDHIWQSIRTFNQYETDALPLLDENNTFCGSVALKDIFNRVFDVFPIRNGGAILELELSYHNYSLHELAGIIESVNTKITLLSVFPIDGTTKVNVVFSIDKNDATDAIQALERHSYHVNAWFMNKGKMDHILEERYNAFMKYINV